MIFPGIECKSVMHESPVFLWAKEQLFCSRQATDKHLECFTIHLITTVDSEMRHDGLLSTLSPDHYLRFKFVTRRDVVTL